MQPSKEYEEESDSDDDPDYVPPADNTEFSGDEREVKRVKISPPRLTEAEEAEKKRAREALWAEFQASLASPKPSTSRPTHTKMVKIEMRHRFAGEEIVEVKEVPEDSDDARKWPLWKPPADAAPPSIQTPSLPATETSNDTPALTGPSPQPIASTSLSQATPSKSVKKPGPRKGKIKLTPIPNPPKAKKLTTLDKSAMDWKAHVTSTPDSALKDELEANRRGGGYLEKVEFLQRVGERKDEAFEANKSAKRRRG